MNLTATHISLRGSGRLVFLLATAAVLAGVALNPPRGCARDSAHAAAPRVITITYTASTGATRDAVVLLPAGYSPRHNPPLPLVISPHGRGATGRSNAKFWGNLPTVGDFAVVCPDGMGRRLRNFSYGYPGQIDDLARMPQIVVRAMPWVHVDSRRIYALGAAWAARRRCCSSRGTRVLAGAAAMDPVDRLRAAYGSPPNGRKAACQKRWGAAGALPAQRCVVESADSPSKANPRATAARSPLSQARRSPTRASRCRSGGARKDKIVVHQGTQSGALYRRLRRLGPQRPVGGVRRPVGDTRRRCGRPPSCHSRSCASVSCPRGLASSPTDVTHLVAAA